MNPRLSLPWLRRLACPALVGGVWWLLREPVVTLPGLGDLTWREIWPQGVFLLKIALGVTALAALLAWSRGLSFAVGGIFTLAAATGLKLQDTIKRITEGVDDPALAGTVQTIVDGAALQRGGWLLLVALAGLLLFAFWPLTRSAPKT